MPHLALLGDSIFDNAQYTGSGPDVVSQVRNLLPSGWGASLLAIDGSTTVNIPDQMQHLPKEGTHLVLSVGGRERLRQRVKTKTSNGYHLRGTVKPSTVHQDLRVLRRILNVAVRKKLLPSNPCSSVEFPVLLKGTFRPHYITWSEQQRIERHSPEYLRNVVRVITETGLRVKKELLSMRKEQADLANATVWIPDSKTPNGIAEVPLTPIAVDAFRSQISLKGPGVYLFPSARNANEHQKSLKRVWRTTLKKAGISYFRIYDLRSTYATRLSAGGVADEWVTQMLRQGDSQVLKKYSQMKLAMKREALEKLNRLANEMTLGGTQPISPDRVLEQF